MPAVVPLQKIEVASAAAVASLEGSFPAAPKEGNLLWALACSDATVTMTSTGWTLQESAVEIVGLYLWTKIAGASEPKTVKVTPSTSASTELYCAEFAASSPAVDKKAKAISAAVVSTASSGETVETTEAVELVFAAFGWNDEGTARTVSSVSNSFEILVQLKGKSTNNTNLVVAAKWVAAKGKQQTTATFTGNVERKISGLIVTFKGAKEAEEGGGGGASKGLAMLL